MADMQSKPTVEIPAGDPPAQLEVEDLVQGDGPEAVPGKTCTMQYVGHSFVVTASPASPGSGTGTRKAAYLPAAAAARK